MQHRPGSPPRLVIIENVFRETAGIQRAEVRANARPPVGRGLAAIIESCPRKSTGDEWARIIDFPPSFGAIRVSGKVDIVGADVSLQLIVHINAAREVTAGRLGSDTRLLWKLCVKLVDVFSSRRSTAAARVAVVETLDIDDARHAFAPGTVHCHCHWPAWIELMRKPFHGRNDSRPALSALLSLFIAERPKNDARMVAIAANHSFELAQPFRSGRHHARLVQHEHAETITSLEQFRRRWIVRGAINSRPHRFEA